MTGAYVNLGSASTLRWFERFNRLIGLSPIGASVDQGSSGVLSISRRPHTTWGGGIDVEQAAFVITVLERPDVVDGIRSDAFEMRWSYGV